MSKVKYYYDKETLSYKLKFPTYKEGLNEIYDHFV